MILIVGHSRLLLILTLILLLDPLREPNKTYTLLFHNSSAISTGPSLIVRLYKDLNSNVQLVVHYRVRPRSIHRTCQKDGRPLSPSRRSLLSRRWRPHQSSTTLNLWLHISFQVDERYLEERPSRRLRPGSLLCQADCEQCLRNTSYSLCAPQCPHRHWRMPPRVLLVCQRTSSWRKRPSTQ